MKNKKIWISITTLLIIATAVVTGILLYNTSDSVKFQKQIDLGQKYLSEMNYEEAIVAFNQAIKIDPMSGEAYWGLADAYIGLGDTDTALEILLEGYDVTRDERLWEYLEKLEEEKDRLEDEKDRLEDESEPNREEWIQTIQEIPFFNDDSIYLTYAEREAVYRPFVPVLLEIVDTDPSFLFVYDTFSNVYLALNEPENCLTIRQIGYENTGDESLLPTEKTDAYGLPLEGVNAIYQYNNQHQLVSTEITEGDDQGSVYEYDSEGRTIRKAVTSYYKGKLSCTYVDNYTYTGDRTVTINREGVNYKTDGPENFMLTCIDMYDMYGHIIDSNWFFP